MLFRSEFPFLKEIDSLALANAQLNLDKAYKNFFRDKSVGFPRFKSKKNPVHEGPFVIKTYSPVGQ